MSNVLVGRRATSARQLSIGSAAALPVKAGDLVQIVALSGKQVASFVAVGDNGRLSPSTTITSNGSVVLKIGDKLYSQHRTPMFELVEDSVARHDLLTSPLPVDADVKSAIKHSTATALAEAATGAGVDPSDATDPVNFFKNVVIKQRGEIEVKDSFAQRNDAVILRALVDCTAVVANAYPEKKAGVGLASTAKGRPAHLLVRVFS